VDRVVAARNDIPEGGSKIVFITDVDKPHPQPKRLCCRFNIARIPFRSRVGRPHEYGNRIHFWCDLVQHLEALGLKCAPQEGNPGHIASGPVEAFHIAGRHRIVGCCKYDRERLGGSYRGFDRIVAAARQDHAYALPYELLRQHRQPVVMIVRIAKGQRYVLTFDIPGIAQALPERRNSRRPVVRRCGTEKADNRLVCRLLRTRRKRPRRCCAANKRNEIPSPNGQPLYGKSLPLAGPVVQHSNSACFMSVVGQLLPIPPARTMSA